MIERTAAVCSLLTALALALVPGAARAAEAHAEARALLDGAPKLALPLVLDEQSVLRLTEGKPPLTATAVKALQAGKRLQPGDGVTIQLLGRVELRGEVATLLVAKTTEGEQSVFAFQYDATGALRSARCVYYDDQVEGWSSRSSKLRAGAVQVKCVQAGSEETLPTEAVVELTVDASGAVHERILRAEPKDARCRD